MGRSVAELRESLSAQEFLEWGIYFARKAQKQEVEMQMAKGG